MKLELKNSLSIKLLRVVLLSAFVVGVVLSCAQIVFDAYKTRQAVAGDDRPAGPSPSDVVGIRGNTKVWKETIKNCANLAGFGKFKWDGDALVWNVYRSTWDYLVSTYPRAAEQLELADATRSI